MSVAYNVFVGAFLNKITERDLMMIDLDEREEIVFGYMKRAIAGFKRICKYDLTSTADDDNKCFDVIIPDYDIDEIVDIVSEGMVVQWLKPYIYSQELLENALNTRDFTVYSPAELLMRVGNAYEAAKKDYTQMMREYSFNTRKLTDLHI